MQQYKLSTATAVIIANMIGTGVFASLFFQIESLPDGGAILVLWAVGGIVALSGGLCYAELSGLFPRSGGEYEYLSRIYHPALGFATGVCTIVVGFAAPMAGVALNLGNYLSPLLGVEQDTWTTKGVALLSVIGIAGVQLFGVRISSWFQDISTLFKLLLIVIFIALPFVGISYTPSAVTFSLTANTWQLVFSGAFFANLAMLYYAYTGWNASVYIASEVENPRRTLPLSILIGVFGVTALYLLLNFAFLKIASFEDIRAGGPSIGNTVVRKLFGAKQLGGLPITTLFSVGMSVALLATLNSFMIAAPSVAKVMGKDYPLFQKFAKQRPNGAPYVAIAVMTALTTLFILLSNIRAIFDYVGFSLSFFASLSVLGVIIMRWRAPHLPRPFKAVGYPFTPLIFLAINTAMVYYSVQTLYGGNFFYQIAPDGSLSIGALSASFFTVLAGLLLYVIMQFFAERQSILPK